MSRSGAASGGSGGSSNGRLVHKFAWTSSTAGLFTSSGGWTFYTGTAGDLLHNITILVDTMAGSAAFMDVGCLPLSGSQQGFIRTWSGTWFSVGNSIGVPVSNPFPGMTGVKGYAQNVGTVPGNLEAAAAEAAGAASTFEQAAGPIVFTANQGLTAWATSTGNWSSAAVVTPGSAAGTIYIETSTPT